MALLSKLLSSTTRRSGPDQREKIPFGADHEGVTWVEAPDFMGDGTEIIRRDGVSVRTSYEDPTRFTKVKPETDYRWMDESVPMSRRIKYHEAIQAIVTALEEKEVRDRITASEIVDKYLKLG